jgi:hypothetical protein
MEPQWQRLQREFADQLIVTYKMGGLLPSWGLYDDQLNSIRKPIQMVRNGCMRGIFPVYI